jgi:membrane protease YdiL (CAAX protease family)
MKRESYISHLKDAGRLLGYFAATIIFGALIAPPIFWSGQWLAAHGVLPALARFDFEAYFHRAIVLAALVFLFPTIRFMQIRSAKDLGLIQNRHRLRDSGRGFLLAAIPLLCFGGLLLALGTYSLRASISWAALGRIVLTAVVVPLIEEPLFRGFFLGVLLRSCRPAVATVLSAAIFSIVHFLKAPNETTMSPAWYSGFVSISHSLSQFSDPMMLAAGFATLFLIGCILADARIRTGSLWLPIGLHSGWIFASGAFNKIAQREMLALPWLGTSLLIGLAPLCVGLVTWSILVVWFKHARASDS